MMPRGKNGYSWELNSETQDSEVRFYFYIDVIKDNINVFQILVLYII